MIATRSVAGEDWRVVEWLRQAYAHDLSVFRHGSFPRPDGRFNHAHLDRARDDGTAYLAWQASPTGEVPVAFSLVTAGDRGEWHMMAFFVVRPMRRSGLGRELALATIRRHPGAWEIAFQDENPTAARFWRGLADQAFPGGWREEHRPVPGKPGVPPDCWIVAG